MIPSLPNVDIDTEIPLPQGQDSSHYRCYTSHGLCFLKVYSSSKSYTFSDLHAIHTTLKANNKNCLIQTFDFFRDENTFTVVTEFCEMGTFETFLKSSCEAFKYRVLLDVSRAIGYVHSFGLIVGNILPSSIFVTSLDITLDSIAKLAVSGRIKKLDVHRMPTKQFFKRLVYRAPEVFSKFLQNPESDIFSFGILLYEVFTLSVPYTSDDGKILFFDFFSSTFSFCAKRKYPLTDGVWELIKKCCQYKATLRPTPKEVEEEIVLLSAGKTYIGEGVCTIESEEIEDTLSLVDNYKEVLGKWVGLEKYRVIYSSNTDELCGNVVSNKIYEQSNVMVVVTTLEGHVFGAYVGNQIKKKEEVFRTDVDFKKQNAHFAFTLKNPYNTKPLVFYKRKEYVVALRLYNTKVGEVIAVPSFFIIYSNQDSYISTNFNVVYEDNTNIGFDLFCTGKDYSTAHQVTFNMKELTLLEWF
ncbi:serine-threonine protein kinase, putative [Entamoeba invadens IP1]|uniref:Serine-threonine protein kinase, putative n=1 Tax=Entamoeba invadens IP1 TaxID=370355 RepID=A0A0A1U0F1_ENTIV|nr:serine-threonine protein kinase, putative [Entamoeba invadens IP1]ELP87357.1 serine-threonine protein kinase, putative [Entamoeba invadens IP1]|eukprot:XP_004254128.1 serine-threonine protein kinase, putative [Entamoeba invadens IP1]